MTSPETNLVYSTDRKRKLKFPVYGPALAAALIVLGHELKLVPARHPERGPAWVWLADASAWDDAQRLDQLKKQLAAERTAQPAKEQS